MTSDNYTNAIVTIDKETLAELPAAPYNGPISLIDDKSQIADAIENLRKSPIIGFDTETKPSFKRGEYHDVALIQLATPTQSFLFRINCIGLPSELVDLFEDPKILKVGLSIKDDFHNLAKITEIYPQNFIDLQTFVKDYRIADASLSRIYAILFGQRICKGQRLTNWEAEELTEAQKIYAALDAFACIQIYNHLKNGSFDPLQSKYLTIPETIDPGPNETNAE